VAKEIVTGIQSLLCNVLVEGDHSMNCETSRKRMMIREWGIKALHQGVAYNTVTQEMARITKKRIKLCDLKKALDEALYNLVSKGS
jgi:molybdopterin biosynthesis enzyme MoaB